jgi:hypothetical protein
LSRMNLRLLRGLAGATTLALLATALLSAPALAANGRLVYFGSPISEGGTGGGYNTDGSLIHGTLKNTPVTANNKTAVFLEIANKDNQTLNHVKVAGGDAADGKSFNPSFLPPAGDSLPDDLSLAAVSILSGPAGTTCASSATSFECNVGTLSANASALFLIVIKAPNAEASYPYWFTGSWNEGWSSTGNNADYNFAKGTITVAADSCAGGTASWFLGTEPVVLGDGGGTCFGANAGIKSGAALGQDPAFANGGFASVVVDNGPAVPCPAGFKCFGSTVSVTIISGNPVPGGVEWTVTWEGTKTLKGVIHYGDAYPTDPNDFVAIAFTKANKCTATKTTDCWKSATPSSGKVKPVSITVVFVTEGNGKGGGWI